jgi:carboxypeptidase family protein
MRPYRVSTVCALLVATQLGCTDSLTTPSSPPPSPPSPLGFSLRGRVEDTAGRAVDGAQVEVIEGPGAGTSVVTDASGEFLMPGPFPFSDMTVRASKDEYVPTDQTFQPHPVGSLFQNVFFWLEPVAPTANIAGEYVLTLMADAACTQLPDVARMRTYPTRIEPSSSSKHRYAAVLSGATFFPSASSSGFLLGVAGDFVRAWIEKDGQGFIVEEVGPSTYLEIGGEGDAMANASSMSGPLAGWFEYCASSTPLIGPSYRCPVTVVSCRSSSHRFTLTRRES